MRRRGFSLIELLMAVAVCAILVGLAQPHFEHYALEAQRTRARKDLEDLADAVRRYQRIRGHFLSGTSLEPLVGATLQELPLDPWGNPYFFDGGLSVIGSTAGKELGIETRPIITQYMTYLQPHAARIKGGGFGPTRPGQELEIRMNKPFEVAPGGEALIADDIDLVFPIQPPMTLPASAFGYEYDATRSDPEQGLLTLVAVAPPSDAPGLSGGAGVAFAGLVQGVRELIDPTSLGMMADPSDYMWGPSPPGPDGAPRSVEIRR